MPIYEYKCLECESHFEKMQKVADAPFETCEKCGGKLEKQWSLSGFQFKGAGWYVTDYANKSGATTTEKSEVKSEKTDNTEKSEKSSIPESTTKTESASKPADDNAKSSKKESVTKDN